MKNKAVNILIALLIIGFSMWLYGYDKASQPGGLNHVHADFSDCDNCHIPWQGVRDEMCLQCHTFEDADALDPRIRFHTAEAHCLECHPDHLGSNGNIKDMDHTLLNDALACTDCHYDPHENLFGQNCRNCHRISTWTVQEYQHPSAENKNCNRCHRPPQSHLDSSYWEEILTQHQETRRKPAEISPDACWQCHIPQGWAHLRMAHE